jgi:hypothetical protein
MTARTSYDPKYFAFEMVGISGVADLLNTKYVSGWRVIHMVAHPDGNHAMILLQDSGHAQNN